MKCSVTLEKQHNSGNINMKTLDQNKNPYNKESDLNTIVDRLCIELQDIKNQEQTSEVGMPKYYLDQRDAVRRYYAAFPALKKGDQSTVQYCLPPPAWCRKAVNNTNKINMQYNILSCNDWSKKKFLSGKERRNSYHGQRKHNKKRCHSYSRSFESAEDLPEWVTHEGAWDMESQDPVREFIRAIALDEGYGTCENTVTDEIKVISQIDIMNVNVVPDWEGTLDLGSEWVIKEDLVPRPRSPTEEELYAKFEAKFDRSIEALWSKDQANTPDDEYQDLPIDFQDLLSSPSDRQFQDLAAEKSSLISLTESIWSNDASDGSRWEREVTPRANVDALRDRLQPLQLGPAPRSPGRTLEPYPLYTLEDVYDVVPSITDAMRSLTALNHSKSRSSFAEVLPRPRGSRLPPPAPAPPPLAAWPPPHDREDLLTSARTHFRPIRREAETAAVHYADGAAFDIPGDLDPAVFRRGDSGFLHLEGDAGRYLEYRRGDDIDYGRLDLTPAQRAATGDPDLDRERPFRLRFAVRRSERGVQTEPGGGSGGGGGGGEVAFPASRGELELEEEGEGEAVEEQEGPGEWRADRKRRHSAALRCSRPHAPCSHPHAPFLHCCALDRPLTR